MASRRTFLGFAAGASALAAFRDDGMGRVLAASRQAEGAPAEALAGDEAFWREIQQAFTVDRSFVNLNNGGVCPSPRVVQEAMKRYLDFSNEAPVYTMWQLLEPQIESVRRGLAREFGCDPEEIAITRNATESLETCSSASTSSPATRSSPPPRTTRACSPPGASASGARASC